MTESPYHDPDAQSKGYPRRKVARCLWPHAAEREMACRIACLGNVCATRAKGNCPWKAWSTLSGDERLRYNGQWPWDNSQSGRKWIERHP